MTAATIALAGAIEALVCGEASGRLQVRDPRSEGAGQRFQAFCASEFPGASDR